jgi:hypothetical protein
LRLEEEIAFELVNGLSPEQRGKTVIADTAPAEIRFVGQPHVTPVAPEGLVASEMDEASRDRLTRLIEVYAGMVPEQISSERMETIRGEGPETIFFAWAGATEPGIGHYYRIQGKSFLIELVNTQPDAEGTPANHVHAVWRDLKGDFGLPIQ